jgi:hypothetical protein
VGQFSIGDPDQFSTGSNNSADSVENKWKLRFFLLLGFMLGQTSAILLDAVISLGDYTV